MVNWIRRETDPRYLKSDDTQLMSVLTMGAGGVTWKEIMEQESW